MTRKKRIFIFCLIAIFVVVAGGLTCYFCLREKNDDRPYSQEEMDFVQKFEDESTDVVSGNITKEDLKVHSLLSVKRRWGNFILTEVIKNEGESKKLALYNLSISNDVISASSIDITSLYDLLDFEIMSIENNYLFVSFKDSSSKTLNSIFKIDLESHTLSLSKSDITFQFKSVENGIALFARNINYFYKFKIFDLNNDLFEIDILDDECESFEFNDGKLLVNCFLYRRIYNLTEGSAKIVKTFDNIFTAASGSIYHIKNGGARYLIDEMYSVSHIVGDFYLITNQKVKTENVQNTISKILYGNTVYFAMNYKIYNANTDRIVQTLDSKNGQFYKTNDSGINGIGLILKQTPNGDSYNKNEDSSLLYYNDKFTKIMEYSGKYGKLVSYNDKAFVTSKIVNGEEISYVIDIDGNLIKASNDNYNLIGKTYNSGQIVIEDKQSGRVGLINNNDEKLVDTNYLNIFPQNSDGQTIIKDNFLEVGESGNYYKENYYRFDGISSILISNYCDEFDSILNRGIGIYFEKIGEEYSLYDLNGKVICSNIKSVNFYEENGLINLVYTFINSENMDVVTFKTFAPIVKNISLEILGIVNEKYVSNNVQNTANNLVYNVVDVSNLQNNSEGFNEVNINIGSSLTMEKNHVYVYDVLQNYSNYDAKVLFKIAEDKTISTIIENENGEENVIYSAKLVKSEDNRDYFVEYRGYGFEVSCDGLYAIEPNYAGATHTPEVGEVDQTNNFIEDYTLLYFRGVNITNGYIEVTEYDSYLQVKDGDDIINQKFPIYNGEVVISLEWSKLFEEKYYFAGYEGFDLVRETESSTDSKWQKTIQIKDIEADENSKGKAGLIATIKVKSKWLNVKVQTNVNNIGTFAVKSNSNYFVNNALNVSNTSSLNKIRYSVNYIDKKITNFTVVLAGLLDTDLECYFTYYEYSDYFEGSNGKVFERTYQNDGLDVIFGERQISDDGTISSDGGKSIILAELCLNAMWMNKKFNYTTLIVDRKADATVDTPLEERYNLENAIENSKETSAYTFTNRKLNAINGITYLVSDGLYAFTNLVLPEDNRIADVTNIDINLFSKSYSEAKNEYLSFNAYYETNDMKKELEINYQFENDNGLNESDIKFKIDNGVDTKLHITSYGNGGSLQDKYFGQNLRFEINAEDAYVIKSIKIKVLEPDSFLSKYYELSINDDESTWFIFSKDNGTEYSINLDTDYENQKNLIILDFTDLRVNLSLEVCISSRLFKLSLSNTVDDNLITSSSDIPKILFSDEISGTIGIIEVQYIKYLDNILKNLNSISSFVGSTNSYDIIGYYYFDNQGNRRFLDTKEYSFTYDITLYPIMQNKRLNLIIKDGTEEPSLNRKDFYFGETLLFNKDSGIYSIILEQDYVKKYYDFYDSTGNKLDDQYFYLTSVSVGSYEILNSKYLNFDEYTYIDDLCYYNYKYNINVGSRTYEISSTFVGDKLPMSNMQYSLNLDVLRKTVTLDNAQKQNREIKYYYYSSTENKYITYERNDEITISSSGYANEPLISQFEKLQNKYILGWFAYSSDKLKMAKWKYPTLNEYDIILNEYRENPYNIFNTLDSKCNGNELNLYAIYQDDIFEFENGIVTRLSKPPIVDEETGEYIYLENYMTDERLEWEEGFIVDYQRYLDVLNTQGKTKQDALESAGYSLSSGEVSVFIIKYSKNHKILEIAVDKRGVQ